MTPHGNLDVGSVNHLDLIQRSIEAYCKAEHNFRFNPEKPLVRLHEPSYGAEEIVAALEVLLSTHVTQGRLVKEFEHKYSGLVNGQSSVACNSGSSANLLAISALCALGDLQEGDEVIVPALSWSTTIWPLVQHGLIPVFVDCDMKTLNIDPEKVAQAISPNTHAIMLVHLYGNPCDMDRLREVSLKSNPILIEDCCEAMGAKYKGQAVGTFGDVSTFSFYYSHHITTMEGGMVTTHHSDIEQKLRIQRSHGWIRDIEHTEALKKMHPNIDPNFLFVDTGYNLRMTELGAAMGLKQLDKLDTFVGYRRVNNMAYKIALEPLGIFDFQEEEEGSSAFGFNLILNEKAKFSLSDIRKFLHNNHIETRPIVAGNMSLQPAMRKIRHQVSGGLKNATKVMSRGFALPNHHYVNGAARDYVICKLREYSCG